MEVSVVEDLEVIIDIEDVAEGMQHLQVYLSRTAENYYTRGSR